MEKQFIYKAKDRRGETITGMVAGQTLREVALHLQTRNLIVLEIKEKRSPKDF